ncbi:MAG: response regulator [Deltaproteobacteria bacterium]|nr:response regulator [Deltaproteobacteria bacterium]
MKNQSQAETDGWKGKSVLVVEDSKLMQEQIVAIFESIGMKVVGTCEDGVAALAKVKELNPDLVSLDIILPDMNGIECYRELKKTNAKVRCIFASVLGAHISENFREDIPAHLFMNKPFLPDQLRESLKKVFS